MMQVQLTGEADTVDGCNSRMCAVMYRDLLGDT